MRISRHDMARDPGATAIEYALIIAVIGAALAAVVALIVAGLRTAYVSAAENLARDTASASASPSPTPTPTPVPSPTLTSAAVPKNGTVSLAPLLAVPGALPTAPAPSIGANPPGGTVAWSGSTLVYSPRNGKTGSTDITYAYSVGGQVYLATIHVVVS